MAREVEPADTANQGVHQKHRDAGVLSGPGLLATEDANLISAYVKNTAEWTMLVTAFNLRTLWRVWRSLVSIPIHQEISPHPAA